MNNNTKRSTSSLARKTAFAAVLLSVFASAAYADPRGNDDQHRNDGRGPQSRDTQQPQRDNQDQSRRDDHGNGAGDNRHASADGRNDRRYDSRDNRHDGGRDNRDRDNHDGGHDRRDYRDSGDAHRHQHFRDGRWQDRYQVRAYREPRGYGRRDWREGEYLPRGYRGRGYVIDNYSDYRLHAPRYGQRWVRVDNDVLLVAVTTGVIIELVNGLFYH